MDVLISHWVFYSFIIGMITLSRIAKQLKPTLAYRLLKIQD